MNVLLSTMNAINNNRMITFVIIVAIGLVWIYFQIPNIKAKTSPKNGAVSSRDEWVVTCFLSAAIMQIMNKIASDTYINNQGDSK